MSVIYDMVVNSGINGFTHSILKMNTSTLKDYACSLSSFEWDANHVLDKHTLLQESNK